MFSGGAVHAFHKAELVYKCGELQMGSVVTLGSCSTGAISSSMAEVDGVEPPTAEVAPPEPPAAPVQDSEPAKDSCGTGGDVSAAEPANCKAASGGLPDAMPGAATDSGGGGTKHGTDVSNVSAACAGATDPESEAQDAADSPAAAVSGEAGETAGAATDPTSAAAASSSPADAASTDASAATATNAATATATSDGAAGAEAAASARDSGADVGQARPPAAVADVEAAASKRLQALPPPQRHGLAAAGLHAVRGRWMRAKNAVATIFRCGSAVRGRVGERCWAEAIRTAKIAQIAEGGEHCGNAHWRARAGMGGHGRARAGRGGHGRAGAGTSLEL